MNMRILLALALLVCGSGAFAADTKISAMTDGGTVQATDKIPAVRAGANVRVVTGTMAAQDADDVAITGGLMDGVRIGDSDPRDAAFDRVNILTQLYLVGAYISTDGETYIDQYSMETDYLTAKSALTVNNKGTFTANGTTAVVVSNSNVNANSIIVPWLKTVGGTPACQPYASAANVAGVSFTVKACSGDTSTYNYVIIN